MHSFPVDLEIRHRAFAEVISSAALMERVATGFRFTEGPVWCDPAAALVFSDIAGDCQYRWRPGEAMQVHRKPSNMANGNTYDAEWRLITCEHAASRLTRTEPDGRIEVLADRYDGKELNSPNDVVVKGDGSVYFTDPTYGRQEFFGRPRKPQLPYRGVYRLGAGGDLTLLADDYDQPNGLCFSPADEFLYVNDTTRNHIRVYTVREDGTIDGGAVFATTVGEGDGSPDGMKTDVDGRLYCTGPGGVHVFAQDGTCLGVIRVPEVVGNFTWGGPDRRELYVCATTSLYRVPVTIPGNVR